MPKPARKRRRLGDLTASDRYLVTERPGHVRAFDFQSDQTADGRAARLCNTMDEFSCEALVMHTDRSIAAHTVVDLLEGRVAERALRSIYGWITGRR